MPIRDSEARLKSIQHDYTPDEVTMPTSWDVALFSGDPMVDPAEGGGVEVSGPGYARVTITAADFMVGESGEDLLAMVQFADSTDEWDAEITHYGLFGSDGYWWDCNELAQPVVVTGAGSFEPIQIDLYYGDAVTTDEEP